MHSHSEVRRAPSSSLPAAAGLAGLAGLAAAAGLLLLDREEALQLAGPERVLFVVRYGPDGAGNLSNGNWFRGGGEVGRQAMRFL